MCGKFLFMSSFNWTYIATIINNKNIFSFLSQILSSVSLPRPTFSPLKGKSWLNEENLGPKDKTNHEILKVESCYFEGKELHWLSIVAMYVQLKLNKKRVFSAPMPTIFMGLVYCACSHLHSASENKSKFC